MNNNYEDSVSKLLGQYITDFRINDNEIQTNILEAVIDNMSEEIILFDKNSRFIMINKSVRDNPAYDFTKMNDYYDFYNQVIFYDLKGRLIPFEDIPSQRVLRGEKFTDYRLRLLNVSNGLQVYKEYSGTPIYDKNYNLVGGFVLAQYIEEKIRREDSSYIKTQYDSLKKIIENLDLGFARYTYPEFKFIGINHKGYELLKELFPDLVPQEELKNISMHDIFVGKVHIIDNIIHESLNNKKTSCFRISKYKTYKGETVYYRWIYQPLLNLKGEILEVIITGINITKEMKEMEEALRIQDEIYANVSHELKTPLNVIFSANQMMDIYLNNDSINEYKEKLNNYNHSIKQNCYRLIKLINNIVDLSKSNSGLLEINPININIVNVVRSIINSVSIYVKSKGLEITFYSNVEVKIIACDVSMIERVMLNLISNAVKFSKTNGKIKVNVLDKEDIVEISVKDSGTGIKKKHQDLIFQRFYQADKSISRNAEGSGIGLSLVKSIIELHGGNIRVESVLGKGSNFIFELPAKVINEKNDIININTNNKVEMLKIEFSDIYEIN